MFDFFATRSRTGLSAVIIMHVQIIFLCIVYLIESIASIQGDSIVISSNLAAAVNQMQGTWTTQSVCESFAVGAIPLRSSFKMVHCIFFSKHCFRF